MLRGEFFGPSSSPSSRLIVALWKCRLAVDWKLGSEQAVQLCSLDDELSRFSEMDKLRALAKRHVDFGSESVIPYNTQKLEIVFCIQKSCAKTADPPLPGGRICLLCSGGMRNAFPQSNWNSTDQGCVIEIPGIIEEKNAP
ncbi:hypothetical protein HYY75_11550 [bacterium]|nr:hypothetical protein [bacterium]